jgi:hypothetical protein
MHVLLFVNKYIDISLGQEKTKILLKIDQCVK